jgi:hypothetical protein
VSARVRAGGRRPESAHPRPLDWPGRRGHLRRGAGGLAVGGLVRCPARAAFDPIETILGAGSLGAELGRPGPAVGIFVLASVGGGGLLAGISAATRAGRG